MAAPMAWDDGAQVSPDTAPSSEASGGSWWSRWWKRMFPAVPCEEDVARVWEVCPAPAGVYELVLGARWAGFNSAWGGRPGALGGGWDPRLYGIAVRARNERRSYKSVAAEIGVTFAEFSEMVLDAKCRMEFAADCADSLEAKRPRRRMRRWLASPEGQFAKLLPPRERTLYLMAMVGEADLSVAARSVGTTEERAFVVLKNIVRHAGTTTQPSRLKAAAKPPMRRPVRRARPRSRTASRRTRSAVRAGPARPRSRSTDDPEIDPPARGPETAA